MPLSLGLLPVGAAPPIVRCEYAVCIAFLRYPVSDDPRIAIRVTPYLDRRRPLSWIQSSTRPWPRLCCSQPASPTMLEAWAQRGQLSYLSASVWAQFPFGHCRTSRHD